MSEPEHLFVYGTLAPGRSNAHVLGGVPGRWQSASVRGEMDDQGWGLTEGYPGLKPDPGGGVVEGLLFSSAVLGSHWRRLDSFEGEAYCRVPIEVTLANGSIVEAHVYVVRALSDC